MQRWATEKYTNGPVARAARRVVDRSGTWRDQHAALIDLRNHLQDPAQAWLTAPKDRPDHALELPILGRAITLSLIGETTAVSAKAEISRVRIDARAATDYFVLQDIGPVLVRANSGGADGQGLSMSRGVESWLAFLDRIANSGFADEPTPGGELLPGLVTIDPGTVRDAVRRIDVFRQFATNLPAGLPAAVAERLVLELTSELVVGVTSAAGAALRPAQRLGNPSNQVERLARMSPAMEDLSAIEAWLRDRGFNREAATVSEVQARVADSVLLIGTDALFAAEPLSIYLDPTADTDAIVRRFDRGIAHLGRLYQELSDPFVTAASERGKWSAVPWQAIGEDLAAFGRGNTDALLSGYEGMVRAYAEDREAACEAPRPAVAVGRDDYVARATARFRDDLEIACERDREARARLVLARLETYFESKLSWLWPYARDPNALEVAPGTLADYVGMLHDSQEILDTIDSAVARALGDEARFWDRLEDGSVGLRFRVYWRDRPSEEELADNVISLTLQGAEADEEGIYTWRFGAPFAIVLRLAQNSAYRFDQTSELGGTELVIGARNSAGAMLRVLTGLNAGSLLIEAPLRQAEDGSGPTDATETPSLRVTARFTKADGYPLTLPRFGEEARAHFGVPETAPSRLTPPVADSPPQTDRGF